MKTPKEILDDFDKLPERKRLARVYHFQSSQYIFEKNTEDLLRLIDWAGKPENYLPIWDINNRKGFNQFILELERLIHNFVASAKSLIDHSRVLYKANYKKTSEFEDYEEEIRKRFLENPLIQFVQEFREYCQHYKSPPVHCVLSWSQEKGAAHAVCLNRSALEEFDGWNRFAKDFLKSAPEEINVHDVVREYAKLIGDFYQWVDKRLEEIHTKDREVVGNKKKEAWAQLHEHMVDPNRGPQ